MKTTPSDRVEVDLETLSLVTLIIQYAFQMVLSVIIIWFWDQNL